MQATAKLQVMPLGAGVSVRQESNRVVEILKGYGFLMETHASGRRQKCQVLQCRILARPPLHSERIPLTLPAAKV